MNDEKIIPDISLTSAKKVADAHHKSTESALSALERLGQMFVQVPSSAFQPPELSVPDIYKQLPMPERNNNADLLVKSTVQNAETLAVMKDALLELAEMTKAANEKADQAQKENAIISKKESRKSWLNILIAALTLFATIYSIFR